MTPSSPATGLAVAHLFWTAEPGADRAAILAAIDEVASGEDQVVTVSILGHHSDLCTMLLVRDQWTIRRFQTRLAAAGLLLVDSYLSLTELSEYAQGVPEPMKQARLYPATATAREAGLLLLSHVEAAHGRLELVPAAL